MTSPASSSAEVPPKGTVWHPPLPQVETGSSWVVDLYALIPESQVGQPLITPLWNFSRTYPWGVEPHPRGIPFLPLAVQQSDRCSLDHWHPCYGGFVTLTAAWCSHRNYPPVGWVSLGTAWTTDSVEWCWTGKHTGRPAMMAFLTAITQQQDYLKKLHKHVYLLILKYVNYKSLIAHCDLHINDSFLPDYCWLS